MNFFVRFSETGTNFVKFGHPRLEQMAILKENPVALLLPFLDQRRRSRLLTLTQTLLEQFVSKFPFVGVLLKSLVRICSLA